MIKTKPKNNAIIMKILLIYNFPAKLALHADPDNVYPELHD